jgi:hypothetical protein
LTSISSRAPSDDTYAFVSRVPKTCPHDDPGGVYKTIYVQQNPNEPLHIDQAILRGEPEWRHMMKMLGSRQDVTDNLDVWPDWYYVTRCDRCESDRVKAWREMHWDQSPYERQHRFVRTLLFLDTEPMLTPDDVAAVLDLVACYHLTRYDFKRIDEQPYNYSNTGTYAIEVGGENREWHYKLRQVRNRNTRLFDILKANEAEGYEDDNTVPEMPWTFQIRD